MFDRKITIPLQSVTPPAAPSTETKDSHFSTDPLNSGPEKDFERKAWDQELHDKKVTLRLKSAAGMGFGLLVFYALCTSVFSGGPSQRSEPTRIAQQISMEDRFPERTKAKLGFFQRIFCSGLQRSTFCD